jgi:hypothetical protein
VLDELDDGRNGRFLQLGGLQAGFLGYLGEPVAQVGGAIAPRDQCDDKVAGLMNAPRSRGCR